MSEVDNKKTKSLADILGEIPSLQGVEDYTETVEVTEEATTIYDENITHDMAKVILGHKYDPKCRYKLITQQDSTTLIKINDNWPSDKEDVVDATGRIIDGRIVEYTLDTEDSKDVQSYSDMMLGIERSDLNPMPKNIYGFREKKTFKHYFLVGSIVFAVAVLLLWGVALVFLNTLRGGF